MAAAEPLNFAQLLKRQRLAAGLTQTELADRAGISSAAVTSLERGVSRTPHQDTVTRLANALHLTGRDRARFEAAAGGRASAGRQGDQPETAGPSPALPQLAGRVREVARLERHLAESGPPLLLFGGEPGIGKTRLLKEAVLRARAHGLTVLEGGCHRHSGQEPYAPVLGALGTYVHRQTSTYLRTALEGCAWLVRLLPELVDLTQVSAPSWTLPPAQERRLVFEAVGRFLANVAGVGGTLLVLDDLQWAGADALDLLAALVHSSGEAPLRVVGAYRDTEVDSRHLLADLLADLSGESLVAQMQLNPLAPREAAELLDTLIMAAPADDATLRLREQVLQQAGGVPFYLVSCAQGLRAGTLTLRDADEIPWDVRQNIRQRVAALPEYAQEVLGIAAVAGQQVEEAVVLSASHPPIPSEREVLAAIETTCRAGLLVEVDESAYQFTHDLIREVLMADLSPMRRRVLHLAVAVALEAAPGEPPIERLAFHYASSGNQEKALIYLTQAAERAAARYAHAEVEYYYREVVTRLDELGRTVEAAQAREKLGTTLRIAARYDQALEALELAAETYRASGDLEGLRRALAEIGQVHGDRATPQQGLARLQPVLPALGASEPSASLAALHATLARLYYVCDRYEEQLVAAEQAAAIARAVGDRRIEAAAEQQRGLALLNLGRVADARKVLEGTITLADAAGDLWTLCFALSALCVVYVARGAFDQGYSAAQRAVECAQLIGAPTVMAFMAQRRGAAAYFMGRWDQARADAEHALALVEPIEPSLTRLYPLLMLGRISLCQGQWDVGQRHLREAIALAERSGNLYGLRSAHGPLAERDVLAQDPASARTRLEPLLDRPGLQEGDVTTLLPILAWAYDALGDEARADDLLAQSEARAVPEQMRATLVDTFRVRALVALRRQRWQTAEDALAESLALARAMPYPYAEAKALYVYGLLHAASGGPHQARASYEAALAICERLGERLYAEQVERELAALTRDYGLSDE